MQSDTDPTNPTPAQLAPILRDLNLATPVALVSLDGGGSPVYRIDLSDSTAVILKTYDDVRYKLPIRESYAAGLLRDLDVPVTRYLALDETRSRLPFRYAITNYLPGVAVSAFKDAPDVADLYRQMGALLRRLHSIKVPAYGTFGDNGVNDPAATNAEHIRDFAASSFAKFRQHGGDGALAARLEAILDAHADTIAHSKGAVFAHDDFHPGNVLAERDGAGRLRLTGVIDFGNARAADPISDLAKTLFCCEHDAPGSSPAIREGYGPIDHPAPETALWLYALHHRVIMWWWLRYVGVIPDGEKHDLIVSLERMADEAR